MNHPVTWSAPLPWTDASTRPPAPVLLRFADDDFMDDLLAQLARDPSELASREAGYETWFEPLGGARVNAAAREVQPLRIGQLFRQGLQARQLRLAAQANVARASGPMVSRAVAAVPLAEAHRLKLYPPSAQRHYVATAQLICRIPGLPDRTVRAGQQERVGFIVRRLESLSDIPPRMHLDAAGRYDTTQWRELAFVAGDGPPAWQTVPADNRARLEGEEFTALFPLPYFETDGHRRRLYGAVVPVSKREGYVGAPLAAALVASAGLDASADPASALMGDARLVAFRNRVTEPWKRLLERAAQARRTDEDNDSGVMPSHKLLQSRKSLREQVQTVSWYVLLDLATLLEQHLPSVAAVLLRQKPVPNGAPKAAALAEALAAAAVSDALANALLIDHAGSPAVVRRLDAALRAVRGFNASAENRSGAQIEQALDRVERDYDRSAPHADWPLFLFPLADSQYGAPLPDVRDGAGLTVEQQIGAIGELERQIASALIESDEQAREQVATQGGTVPSAKPQPPNPAGAMRGVDLREPWFVIRFVYERPNCAPLEPSVLSEPSAPFQMAGFFDPDAPARPIRIGLPIDPTPAGLRKFDRNTAFVMSDLMCRQVQRVKGLGLGDLIRSVLPWPLHKDLEIPEPKACHGGSLDLGMVCSLSIPIITICALLLLMIVVTLLDLVFRWLPFFFVCFPVPGLKAKPPSAGAGGGQ